MRECLLGELEMLIESFQFDFPVLHKLYSLKPVCLQGRAAIFPISSEFATSSQGSGLLGLQPALRSRVCIVKLIVSSL